MPQQDLTLAFQSNPTRYGYEGGGLLKNCYAEEIGSEGKVRIAIYAADGVASFAPIPSGSGGMRAMLEVGGFLYAAIGSTAYRVSSDGTSVTTVGGFSSVDGGLVTMARNRKTATQIGLVSNGQLYIITGTSISLVSDADLPPPVSVSHLDGYFMLPIADGRIFYTAIDEGSTVDALDFIRAESNPDGCVRGFVRGRDFVAFGDYSMEFWNNTGGADSPFSRQGTTDIGCLAAGSVATVGETVGWLAHDGTVRLMEGYSGRIISTAAVERAVEDDPLRTRITGFSWQSRGHTFYAISGSNFTYIYDLRSGLWHNRESFGEDRWRLLHSAKVGANNLFGDYALPKLYRSSPDLFTDDGSPLEVEIILPPVHGHPNKIQHNAVYLDMLPGVGINNELSPADHDPVVILDYSEDGWRTWSAPRDLRLGKQGETQTRMRAHRLGMSRANGRAYRVRCSAAVARALLAASADVEVLR